MEPSINEIADILRNKLDRNEAPAGYTACLCGLNAVKGIIPEGEIYICARCQHDIDNSPCKCRDYYKKHIP